MKLLKQKKRMLSLLLATTMITGNFSGMSTAAYANGYSKVEMDFESSYDEETNTEVITAMAFSPDDNITVSGITLPDGTFVEGDLAEYAARKNGNYDFVVHYEEMISDEDEPVEKVPSVGGKVPSEEETAADGDILPDEEVPSEEETVADEEILPDEEVPSEGETVADEDTLPDEEAPSEEETAAGEEAAEEEEAPSEGETVEEEDSLPDEEAPSEEDDAAEEEAPAENEDQAGEEDSAGEVDSAEETMIPEVNADEMEDGEIADLIIVTGKKRFTFTATMVQDSVLTLDFESSYYEESNTEVILATASSAKKNIRISGITLPDGTFTEGSEVTYIAKENGDFDFVVHYEELIDAEIEDEEILDEETATDSDATVYERSTNKKKASDSNLADPIILRETELFRYQVRQLKENRAPKGLITLTSNKEMGGWKWWVDDSSDETAGNTHLQYTLKVMKDTSDTASEERIITFALGDEDEGIFEITEVGKDSLVIKDQSIDADNRTMRLVLNNDQIADSGWSVGIIVMPEGKDVRSTHTNEAATYGSYIGGKFFENQNFGASATASEGDTVTCEIDFAWEQLYDETGGDDSINWLSFTGDYTDQPDSPKSLANLEMRMIDGQIGYQGETEAGEILVVTTDKAHMPAGNVRGNFYTPSIYTFQAGTKLPTFPDQDITVKNGLGVSGAIERWNTTITRNRYGSNVPSSDKSIQPGAYPAGKDSVVEWEQLEYNKADKTLSKVTKSISLGEMTITVPNFTPVKGLTFETTPQTVDVSVSSVALVYNISERADSYDYENGTITFDIPEHFAVRGIGDVVSYKGRALAKEIELTYDDGSKATVLAADLTEDEDNLPIPNGQKITKIVCKLTDIGLPGPYAIDGSFPALKNIKHMLYGDFTDPDPATDGRDNPDANSIIIPVTFASEDGLFTEQTEIKAIYFAEGNPVDKPYIKNENNYLVFDSSQTSKGNHVTVGIDNLKDLGSDGLTSVSPRYKNLEIELHPDAGSDVGDEQWKTIYAYTFNQINGNIPGTGRLEYYADAWIEYTLTGDNTPRKVFIHKDGELRGSFNWDVPFPGYDPENQVFLTSLKLHFEDVSIPSKTKENALQELVAFTYNQDRRWVSSNPAYDGKERLNCSWAVSLTYDGQAQATQATAGSEYLLYAESYIQMANTSQITVGIQAPSTAVKGDYISSEIKVILPFSVDSVHWAGWPGCELGGKMYAPPLPVGSNVYLKLNSEFFSYYGPTKDTNPDSRIEVITDHAGDTWIVYDKSGDTPATGEGSKDFTAQIPADSIMVNPAANSGGQYEIFTEAYVDVKPLEQMSRNEHVGKINYIYKDKSDGDYYITDKLVADIWGIANGSDGLVSIPILNETQITEATQEKLYVIPGVDRYFAATGVQWTADQHNKLRVQVQLGSGIKEYHDYELFIPLPQAGEITNRPAAGETKDNAYTLYVDEVKLPAGIQGTVTYHETVDGTDQGSSAADKNTKSIKVTLATFTGNIGIDLGLYTDADRTYSLEDLSAAYMTASSSFEYYPWNEKTGQFDRTQLLSGTAEASNFAKYSFGYYSLSGKIFIESSAEEPDGLYGGTDSLYFEDRFLFEDLADGKRYEAKVNPDMGRYSLRLPPKAAGDYKLAPVISDDQFVLTKATNTEPTEETNTNFPRDYKREGAEFSANVNGLTKKTYINDFAHANVGLFKQDAIVFPVKVKVGEQITFDVVPSYGGKFDKISDAGGDTTYGAFSVTITQGNNENKVGTVTLDGLKETLGLDGKTLEYRDFTVSFNNYFNEPYTKTSRYQIYKDPFVTFTKGTGSWVDGSVQDKEVLLAVANTGDTSGTIKDTQIPALEKTGYHISDWKITRDGNDFTAGSVSLEGIMLEKYDVLTPVFEVNTYDVVYKVDGAVVHTEWHDYKSQVTIRDKYQKEGYTVSNWMMGGADATDFTMPANDVEITATTTINSYDVVYKVDGAFVYTDEYNYNTQVTIRDKYQKEGYTVSNWKRNGADATGFTMPADNVEITATTTINSYDVVYKVDGAVVYTDAYNYKTQVTIRDKYQKEGYTVSNWKMGGADAMAFTMPANDVEITATTTINSYDVVYKVDGAVVYTDAYDYKTQVTIRDKYQKEGYTVSNWKRNGADAADFTMPAGNVEITATTTINSYDVVYKIDGAVMYTDAYDYKSQVTIREKYQKEGYTVSNWKRDGADATDFTMPAGNVELTATTAINRYQVKFVDYDGTTVLKEEIVSHGSAATAPADPVRTNYRFTGWDKDFDNITSDLIVTAQYRYITNSESGGGSGGSGNGGSGNSTIFYNLYFDTNGGSSISTQSVRAGRTVELVREPVKAGFVFDGWHADKELTNWISSVYMDGNKTVYAKWTAEEEKEKLPVLPETLPTDPTDPTDPTNPPADKMPAPAVGVEGNVAGAVGAGTSGTRTEQNIAENDSAEEISDSRTDIKITSDGVVEGGAAKDVEAGIQEVWTNIETTDYNKENVGNMNPTELGDYDKNHCILHWIFTLLALVTTAITLIKRRKNRKELNAV